MKIAVEDVEGRTRGSAYRFRATANVLVALFIITIALALILPALQITGRRPRSQAWRNLHQLGLSLANYHYKHGAYPYDSRGPDYALYLLYADAQANGWTLDAAFFDSHPHDQPRPEAKWDHAAGRIIHSDFDYWNNPDPHGALTRRLYSCPMVLVLERPAPGVKSLLFSTTDARISSCGVPEGEYKKLFGSVVAGEFLVATPELFDEWEQVRLPADIQGSSHATGRHTDFEQAGGVVISYAYRGDHLAQRTYTSPSGTIIDTVTTDEIGRITGIGREPADWRKILPVQRNADVP
jgi:hypothetical protein